MMKIEKFSFLKHIKSKNFFGIKKRILIAVSGGIDSMVLLHLMQQSDYQIAVAHIDHHTRGGQSTEDAIFVEKYCKKHHIDFHKSDFNDDKSGNFHHKAHKFRYQFFSSLRYDYTLTAHHYDDNIETIFLNFLNGKSNSGIAEVNKNIVRPLLVYTKNSIRDYAVHNNIDFVKDQSNESNNYDRNFIRNKVLPLLQSHFADTEEKLINQSERNNLDSILLSQLVAEKLELDSSNRSAVIPKHLIRSKPTLLYHFLKHYGYNRHQAKDMTNAIDHIGSIFHSEEHTVVVDRELLILKEKEDIVTDVIYITLEDTPLIINYLNQKFKFEKVDFFGKNTSHILYIPKRKLDETLMLRTWREGDIFQPNGMEGHSKTLKKYFTDSKINRLQKHQIPILTSGEDIVWICGHRSDHRYRFSETDTDFIKVSLLS
ncbi:tRNA lysidine(34) synthetase TilS [Saprospiraceae bacterium]|nr:tRNA lysidine(34) synthetase TilS [Saprospiraceae bacterium]